MISQMKSYMLLLLLSTRVKFVNYYKFSVAGLVISVATLEEIMPYCHVTLFVSLLWMTERFSSTFFIKMAVSDVVKFGFWTA